MRRRAELGAPIVLKTRRYGYDGKGQAWIRSRTRPGGLGGDRRRACHRRGRRSPFDAEFSVILARSADGGHAFWDSPLNVHEGGILRRSTVPAGQAVLPQVEEARRAALAIAEALGHVGVLTVEFFAGAGGPIVNEIAPRVHNSGHWTIEGAETSQFEQHIRAICGLPLGSTGTGRPPGDNGQSDRRGCRGVGPTWSPRRAPTFTYTARGSSPRPQDGPRHPRQPLGRAVGAAVEAGERRRR